MADDADVNECVAKKPRFASLTDDNLTNILKEKDSLNTRKATDRSVRLFKKYLQEKELDQDFENYTLQELDEVLCKFYSEARNEKGDLYKKSTLTNTRYGLNRYLNEKKGIDIIKDKMFMNSDKMFKAVNVLLKREGMGGIDHYPPIENDDLKTIYASLKDSNPTTLQHKVFVDIMLYFGRRGRENLRSLKSTDFAICSKKFKSGKQGGGDVEHRFIYIKRDELTKNHQTDTNTAVGKMFEVKGDERCPVKSFLLYRDRLNPKCDIFFQRPKINPSNNIWYDAVAIGHNTLGSMMPEICNRANLETTYTNHSLRATTVHILDEADFAGRHIMSVTGHKSETSLKTYTGYTSEKALKSMSSVISGSLRPENEDNKENMSDNAIKTDIEDFYDDNITDFLLLSNSQMENLVASFNNPDNMLTSDNIFANPTENVRTSVMPMENAQVPQLQQCQQITGYPMQNYVPQQCQQIAGNSMQNYVPQQQITEYSVQNNQSLMCPTLPMINNNYGSITVHYNFR